MLELTGDVRKEATQRKLQSVADALGDEVKVKGKTYKRHQTGTVKYYGLSGCRLVTRSTYREVGVRNGPIIVPLDLVAGLAERTYIANNKDKMRDTRLRDLGLPIGSGVTESTAKNVVNMRTKRSGQRWSIPGLQGVLTLRALLKSDRLARYWTFLSSRYVVNVNLLVTAA